MSIAQEITRLNDAKADIKTSIEGKGVTVPSSTLLDGYADLVDQIQQGAAEEAPENDVNFYDYDGRRVASYTIAEAKALTALPTPPSHEGLTFQEWNWTLADIQGYNRQYIDVGANYITTDEATHIFADVVAGDVCNLRIAMSGMTLRIDWGDGTIVEDSRSLTYQHTYATSGQKEIKLSVVSTTSDYAYYGFDRPATFGILPVSEIRLGKKFSIYYNNTFSSFNCCVSIPTNIVDTGTSPAFTYSSIPCIVIPKGKKVDCDGNFYLFLGERICLPKSVSSMASTSLFQNTSITRLVLPEVESGTLQPLTYCYVIKELSFPYSLQFATLATGKFFTGNKMLHYIDIANGWTPTQSMILTDSIQWQTSDMVNFFNKLGTTSNAITLTFGRNLDKLSAEQKAIATGKGYTLA